MGLPLPLRRSPPLPQQAQLQARLRASSGKPACFSLLPPPLPARMRLGAGRQQHLPAGLAALPDPGLGPRPSPGLSPPFSSSPGHRRDTVAAAPEAARELSLSRSDPSPGPGARTWGTRGALQAWVTRMANLQPQDRLTLDDMRAGQEGRHWPDPGPQAPLGPPRPWSEVGWGQAPQATE